MLTLLAIMSALLGLSSFGFGILPLSFVFSKSHLERLSAFGTGLLLGAALGVIIPEGIETIASANPASALPTRDIALSLLSGFTFMLIIEQLISPHSHSHSHDLILQKINEAPQQVSSEGVEFDAELGELEHEQGLGRASHIHADTTQESFEHTKNARERAYPLTFGLVIHALADGLALGVASLSTAEPGETSSLSFIVFLALIIHKAPTSLALTTSLLATSLPRAECKKHLAVFSASTPLASIASYLLFSLIGDGDGGGWTGIALLVSGGTFLYVATVLQPVSHVGSPSPGDMHPRTRVLMIAAGMFVPFLLSAFFGHGH